LAVGLVVGGVVLLGNQRNGAGLPTQAPVDDTLAGAGQSTTGVGDAAGGVVQRLTQMWNATARIEELERENAELKEWRDYARALAERNGRYERLLGMPESVAAADVGVHPDAGIAARVVMRAGGPFKRTLLANAGDNLGVKLGYVALNEHGLVGRVISVGRNSSRVLLLDDPTSRVPVMGALSRVRGLVVGDSRGMAQIEGLMQFDEAAFSNPIGAGGPREGELVVTSGDGGLYPSGIPVGVAVRDGATWRVKLAVASGPVDVVRLAPFSDAEPPELSLVSTEGPPPPVYATIPAPALPLAAPVPPPPPPPRPRPPQIGEEVDGAPQDSAPEAPAAPPVAPPVAPPPR
jgi:rod shape-determining protein MreC